MKHQWPSAKGNNGPNGLEPVAHTDNHGSTEGRFETPYGLKGWIAVHLRVGG